VNKADQNTILWWL